MTPIEPLLACICGADVDQDECPYPHGAPDTGRQLFVVNCINYNCGWQAIGWGADGARKAWNTRSNAETISRPEAELPEVTDEMVNLFQRVYGQNFVYGRLLKIPERIKRALQAAYGQQCAATRPAEGGGDGWLPIESAPEDGTPILIAAMDNGQLFDVLHGRFEVLAEDEDDGPWDIRDGEPWCSYEGRTAGIYFCHWLPEKEWESRWKFGPNTGYTHWQPLPTTPGSEVRS